MTTITRRKALTVDALRERLKRVMAKPHDRPCPQCSGSGTVSGPLTPLDVVEGAGITQSAFYGFVRQGKSLSLEAGLKVLAWLDSLERTALDDLDDEHEPRDPEARDVGSERLRQIHNASAAAAARAGIDAMNRPPVKASGANR